MVVIHKRLADILEHHGREFRDVRDDLHVASLAGKDAVLATFSHKSGKMEPTPLYDALLEMAGDIKPVVTGIAASADVFAGDEIDRSQVRQFIALLTRIAMTAGGSPPNSPGQRRYYRQNSSSAPTVKQATSTIPIVFVLGNDPLGSGLVANLARPGGNVTGLSIQQTDIAGKRLQLLSEVVPQLRRLAVIADANFPEGVREIGEVQVASRTLGLEVATHEIRRPEDIAPAFEAIRDRADALYVVVNALFNANRTRVITLALIARLPMILNPAIRRRTCIRNPFCKCLP